MPDLSDDMNRWPSDAYALLGVKPGAAAREIRKAYSELIRRFKPERFPDHFRRIREAYDQVQREESWRTFEKQFQPPVDDQTPASQERERPEEPIASQDLPPPPEVDSQNQAPPKPTEETLSPPLFPPIPPSQPVALPRDGERDALWDLACNGEHSQVYAQLRDRIERGPPDEVVYLQLYWLRVAFPEVEWDVRPLDWAIRAIAAGFEHGRAFELIYAELLYRRQLCRDAALVKLVEQMQHADAIVRLYEVRWQAALGYDQWDLVFDEIPKAKSRLFDQPAHLANLLGWLVGWMAWSFEEHVQRRFKEFRKELESIAGGNRNYDYVLERLDFLDELIDQWRLLSDSRFLHREIRELLPVSWIGTAGELRWGVFGFYQRVAKNVGLSMNALDALVQSAPLVLTQLLISAQQTYFASQGLFRPTKDDVVAVFAALRRVHGDDAKRSDVLDFLVRERLTVDDFLNNIPFQEVSEEAQALLARLATDTPLRLVNMAQLTLGG